MKLLAVCLFIGAVSCKSLSDDPQAHPPHWGPPPPSGAFPPMFGFPGPHGPPPPPPFLKDVDEDARDEFMKLFEDENVSREEFKARVRAWAEKQGESVQKAVADFEAKIQEHKREADVKIEKLLEELPGAVRKIKELYKDESLSRKQLRKQKHAIVDDLQRESGAAAYFILGMFKPRHMGPPPPPPHGMGGPPPTGVPEGAPEIGIGAGPMGPPPFGAPMFPPMGPRGALPPPPFLKNVSEAAREEFLRLMLNEDMPKSDFKKEVELWAQKYGAEQAVTKFESKMEVSVAESKQKIQKLLKNLEPTFEQLEAVRKDETLTRKQEFKKIRGIFDDLDRKEAMTAHFILSIYGPRPQHPPPPPPHGGPFGLVRGPFGRRGHRGPFPFHPFKDDTPAAVIPQTQNFA